MDRHTCGQTGRQRDSQPASQPDSQSDSQTDSQPASQPVRQPVRQTDSQPDRQTGLYLPAEESPDTLWYQLDCLITVEDGLGIAPTLAKVRCSC